jgi:hypothetical protein
MVMTRSESPGCRSGMLMLAWVPELTTRMIKDSEENQVNGLWRRFHGHRGLDGPSGY